MQSTLSKVRSTFLPVYCTKKRMCVNKNACTRIKSACAMIKSACELTLWKRHHVSLSPVLSLGLHAHEEKHRILTLSAEHKISN
jgi:hypothetical protein